MCHWHLTFCNVNDRMTVFDSPRCLTRSNCLISISNSCKLTQQTARSYMKCNAGYRIAAGEALEVETANCFHNSPVRFLAVFFFPQDHVCGKVPEFSGCPIFKHASIVTYNSLLRTLYRSRKLYLKTSV